MLYLLLLVGLIFLIKGADLLVDGSSALAKRFGISSAIIGLTIVAFGTSMPELIVNVLSALKGNTDIAFGNIIGSNIANILFILGVTGLICTLKVHKATVRKEIPFSLLAVLVLLVLANSLLIDGVGSMILMRSGGLILLLFFFIFLYYAYESAKKIPGDNNSDNSKSVSYFTIAALIFSGLIGLYFGGKWTVDSAVEIAKAWGMSDFLVSVTIIAIGTSLPELLTSVIAARKNDVDLAVGNIVGSNIFNILWILGFTSLITPIRFPVSSNSDLFVLLLATVLLFVFMFIGQRHQLEKRQSFLFVVLYFGYMRFVIVRG